MSTNLSRRAILAGAASVPALALPAAAAAALPAVVETATAPAAAVAPLPNPDARLLELGEQLKVASAKAARLDARPLYEACSRAGLEALKAAGGDLSKMRTSSQQQAMDRAWKAMAKKNGYHNAYDKWNDACGPRNKLARAILKIPSNSRVGDGIHAAAAMVLNDDIEGAHEIGDLLHEMAAHAGFPVPAKIAKKLARQAAAAGKAVLS